MSAYKYVLLVCLVTLASLNVGYGQQVVPHLVRQFSNIAGVNLNVNGMQADGRGGLWLATEDGVARFDGQQFQSFHDPVRKEGDYYYQITPVSKGRMWLKMESGTSLSYVDVARQCIVRVPDTSKLVRNYLVKYGSHYLFADDQANLWIGLRHHGLLKYNPQTGAITHVVDQQLDVRGITQDRQGILYFTTTASGLFIYNPLTARLRNLRSNPQDKNSLSTDSTHGVYAQKNGHILIGMTNEVNLFKPTTNTVQRLRLSAVRSTNLLNHAHAPEMIPDQQDNLYFTVGTGTFCYTTTDSIRRVVLAEPTEYVESVYVSPANRLWVSANGKLYEYDLRKAPIDASLIILSVDINGIRLENNASATRNLRYDSLGRPTLTLAENDRFNIIFAPLATRQPIYNRWRMDGYEKSWRVTENAEGAASYQLPADQYTLLVNRTLSNGSWSSDILTLPVVVVPPFWKTNPFRLLILSLVGGLSYYIIRTRVRRRQLRQQLEREQQDAAALRQLDELKTHFFANISHEFRTPLTVILGMATELKSYDQMDPQWVQQAGSMIERNGTRLLKLINQILDLAKIGAGQMNLHPVRVNLVAFTRYVCESFHSLASANQIQLHFLTQEESCEVDVDQDKLQDILVNLLANALKFTPAGGRVRVQLTKSDGWQSFGSRGYHEEVVPPAGQNKPWVHISISDTGPGVDPSSLPRIFDRFYQLDNQPDGYGSTGIGLALVRELVMLMQGGLSVLSEPGQGTEFLVSLPLLRQATPTEAALPYSPAEMNQGQLIKPIEPEQVITPDRPRLLLVEDSDDVVSYIRHCVGTTYDVMRAENGQTGIDRALSETPDLILSDVMMPLKDGFTLCRTLKQEERTSHIPIVLLTARAATGDRITGLQYGADAYLVKPFQRQELLVVLANLLQSRRTLQHYYKQLALGISPSGSPGDLASEPLEDQFLQKLRAGIEEQLENPDLSIDQICQLMGMSRTTLHLKLTALTGMPISLYVRLLRLTKAQALLTTSSLTIAEVAYAVGFNDPKYFSRVFQEKYGQSPTTYRQSARAEQ
ncbi:MULTISPECIES: hybrid sensor histidine kinase/response regulator transcription factor [Spirosoma]|uniref:histidine kinase n=1 Tax=Spirosoma liriopis TaxID=2937440 RepID=A0ABT0HVF0_9BACT|nr:MULTISPECIES: hybrid sensor histidine kinase/response regulator transcription factor [Spirosoma]MCK8495578.1 ATP-binding protein [Spirosoma liriopis]UHG94606.1 ATP-binding protein [Spirosoma oryzicola]